MNGRSEPRTTQHQPAASLVSFELDVTLLEVGDIASLTNLTDDNCGTTCGACTTNVA
ncbi:FxLD family lanthipeptide [Streptomyces sp. NPDC004111]|uniref:FxLD family lanthipeptide n=1 Tax=Streptomyces sp. NPDC004111 TaxID=3364690 RepID=UPI00368C3791